MVPLLQFFVRASGIVDTVNRKKGNDQESIQLQSNVNGSNTDGSFTMVYSNSFLSPYEILQIAQKQIFREIFLSYYDIVFCVYSLESPNEYTQHTIIV